MKRLFSMGTLAALALLAAMAASLDACNTARGVGQDMSAAGHAISNTADKAMGE
jgi:predicted small secreted protein